MQALAHSVALNIKRIRDYENIYSLAEGNEQNVAYIKIPQGCVDYSELSSTIDLKISLAEIIAAIIDVSEKQDYYQLIIGMSDADVRKTYLQSNTEENLRIDSVYSYGFSYSKPDAEYIKLIIKQISPNAIWHFSEFEERDREAARIKKVKLRNYGFKGKFGVF